MLSQANQERVRLRDLRVSGRASLFRILLGLIDKKLHLVNKLARDMHCCYSKLKTMQLKQKTNPFSEQINVAENYEVEYWANKFGIRPMALREIIKSTGPNVNDIQKYLGK